MPNDPRVKFHKGGKICKKDIEYLRKHPECYGYAHLRTTGGDGIFGGSNFPTPPGPGPDPDPEPQPQPKPKPNPDPAPLKPGLDPGGIAGITIASAIAMGAAAALAEQERRRRANRRLLPTDDIEMTTARSRPNLNRGGANPNDRAIVPSSSRSGSGSAPSSVRSGSSSASISRSTSGASTPSIEYDSALSGPRGVPTPFTQAGFSGSGDLRTSAPGTRTPAPFGSGAATPYFDAPSPGFDYLSRAPSGTATPKLPPPPKTPKTPKSQATTPMMESLLEEQTRLLAKLTNPDLTPAERTTLRNQITQLENRFKTLDATRAPEKQNLISSSVAEALRRRQAMLEEFGEEMYQQITELQASTPFREGFMTKEEIMENYNLTLEEYNKLFGSSKKSTAGKAALERARAATAGISKKLQPSTPVGNSSANDALNAARPTSSTEMQDLTPQAHAQRTQAAAEAMLADLDTIAPTADPRAIAERQRLISPDGSMESLDINEPVRERGPSLLERGRAAAREQLERGRVATSGFVEDLQKMGSRAKLPSLPKAKMPVEKTPLLAETEMRGSSLRTPVAPAPAPAPAPTPAPAPVEKTPAPAKGTPLQPQETASGAAPLTEEEAIELAIKQSLLEKGLGYTSLGGESSKGVTAEMLRSEPPSRGPLPRQQEPVQGPRTRQGKETVSSEPLPRDYVAPRAKAPVERIVLGAPPPPPAQAPVERIVLGPPPPTLEEVRTEPVEDIRTEPVFDLIDMLNAEYASLVEQEIKAGRPIPEVPEKIRTGLNPKMRSQKYIKEEILKRRRALELQQPSVERPPQPPATVQPSVETQRPPIQEATPLQELNEHLKHLEDFHRSVVEGYAKEGRPVPETSQLSLGEWAKKTYVVKQALKDPANANRTITLESGQEITMEEALGDLMARNKEIKRLTKELELSPDSELKAISEAMTESKAPTKSKFGARKGPKPEQARKLTKKGTISATMEREMLQMPSTAARPSEVRAGTSTEARAAAAPAQAPAPEARAMSAAPPPPPDVAARRRLGVPELTAPPPAPPTETASFADRRAFFEETSKVKPPTGEPAPSAPPSAPESEVATPRESAVREQTPAERAAFAEELTGRLKKGPARQKAKINIGKPNKGTSNPLDIFVSPQHRNIPNSELNPRVKSFRGTLTEISARVPRLVPSRTTLINMGAEGGAMAGGFAAGYFSAQLMNDWFAKHPAKNLGEQYGQALATTFVGMTVGSITQQVLSAVIRRGVNYAITGEVAALAGFTSGAGTAFLTSIGEAALFTAVGVTTQMLTTKFLEDAGFNHAISRSVGAAVSTYALAETEYYLWAAKSAGGLNLAADASLIASETMIIGFGIYQTITEYIEGAKQDEEEEEYQAQVAENKRLNEERDRVIDTTLKRNNARQAFMIAYEAADYDFDKALAAMTPQQRIDIGEGADAKDPNSLVAFRAQVEAAFDPLLDTTIPEGYKPDPRPLSREEQLKKDTYNAYITWYIDSLNGKNPPPFDINSEGAQLLSRETGGTWMSAANVHAQTSITMARRTNPLIQNAQEEIVNAFHKEHKTIEEMPYDIVQYADLDTGFRGRYNAYIIAEAQTQIYMEYNTAGITYNDMDPKLVAIANRDSEFRGAIDTYYQVIANQMRDYDLTIQEAVHLNALAANGEQVEIGKLNDARNKIIQAHQAANQEIVDRYNANIISELSAYGDNLEAIIRNINDQALLTGHTFLYAGNRADLYRQLHMEMPELELVDPDTDTGPTTDAPLPGPSKGRKLGDTALYGYRYNLTDEQNQELDEQARIGVFADNETQMAAAAAIIYERDRYLFEYTDAEKAAKENLTLDEYYKKYGVPTEPPIMEWERSKGNPKEDGKYRFPDGSIETWRNGIRVKVDTTNVVAPPAITKYDPTLPAQPDGQIEMPSGAVRTYKDGLVTSVKYPAGTKAAEMLTPDEINAKERPTTTTPTEPTIDPDVTFEELQILYPETYDLLRRRYGDSGLGDEKIEKALRDAYMEGYDETTGTTETGNPPGGIIPYKPPVTPTEPKQKVLFSGDRNMPDGSTRVYVDGKIVGISYPTGYPKSQMQKLDKQSLADLNKQEGLYYVEVEPTPVVEPTPADPTTLKQGNVTMPDGSTRVYKNGLVVEVSYPPNMADLGNKNPAQINESEGIRGADWTPQAPVVTPIEPVVDKNTLLQGRVTMPDRSTRTYIDGLVVSVQYPEGKTGPNINEINASEGVQNAKDPGAKPDFGAGSPQAIEQAMKDKQAAADREREAAAAAAEAENPEPEIYVNPGANPRYIASKQAPAPAPAPTQAQALNLAVAPMAAPATTSMPETTTPGIAY